MLRQVFVAFLAVSASQLPLAASAEPADEVIRLLRLNEVVEIMRLEGLEHGEEIGATLIGPRAGRLWRERVEAIYGAARLKGGFHDHFAAAFDAPDDKLEAITGFFGSQTGQRILELEIGARRAMLDPDVDEGAREAGALLRDRDPDRFARLERFAAANDLIEQNVVGGLNSTFAFYQGLREGGAPGFAMGDGEMLSEVAGQEEDIRADIEEWVFGYLGLAYSPLGDDELDAYIAFSEQPAGQVLNGALFAAFNQLFTEISHELGLAAGQVMSGEDI